MEVRDWPLPGGGSLDLHWASISPAIAAPASTDLGTGHNETQALDP